MAFWSTLIPSASFAVFLAVTYFLFDYFKVLRTDIRELMWSFFTMVAMVFFIYRLAKAVFSPLTARTPTPCSMLNEPVLTIPSSRLQPSERVYWK